MIDFSGELTIAHRVRFIERIEEWQSASRGGIT